MRLSLQVDLLVEAPRQRRDARVNRGGEGPVVHVSLEEHRRRLRAHVAELTQRLDVMTLGVGRIAWPRVDDDDDALVSAAMQSAFTKADAMFLQKCTDENLGNVGTTVTTVLCMGDTMYCANAGDSRTVLSRAGKAINLSEDHKPSNTIEEQRVRDAGGFVVMGRVMGKLAVSRAIGDSEFKDPNSRLMSEFSISTPLVVPEPEVVVSHIEAADEFLILACDGLWDIFSSQEAVDMVVASLKTGSHSCRVPPDRVGYCLHKTQRRSV